MIGKDKNMNIHPLKNPDSKGHYGNMIEDMEKTSSVASMMGFVENNIEKYRRRLGKKSHLSGVVKDILDLHFIDHPGEFEQFKEIHLEEVRQSDLKKIETYKAYGDVLKDLLHKGYKGMTVSYALESEGIEYE